MLWSPSGLTPLWTPPANNQCNQLVFPVIWLTYIIPAVGVGSSRIPSCFYVFSPSDPIVLARPITYWWVTLDILIRGLCLHQFAATSTDSGALNAFFTRLPKVWNAGEVRAARSLCPFDSFLSLVRPSLLLYTIARVFYMDCPRFYHNPLLSFLWTLNIDLCSFV